MNQLTVHFQYLHSLTPLVLSDKLQTARAFELFDKLGSDFVPVPVSFPDDFLTSVQLLELGPLRVGLKDGGSQTESHGTSEMSL